MRVIVIIISLIVVNVKLLAQNLVPNSSFENKGLINSFPDNYSQAKRLADWHEFGSSDWYYEGEFLGNDNRLRDPKFYSTNAYSGNGFIGFGPCEGAQVKLSRKIEAREYVKISFSYLVPKDSVDTSINFYLYTNKENEDNLTQHCLDFDFDTSFHITVPINSAGPDKTIFPYTWYRYEGIFPIRYADDYEWLAFKGPNNDNGSLPDPMYVCIDDIRLEAYDYCQHPCVVDDLYRPIIYNPVLSNACTPNVTPFQLTIGNATRYELDIRSAQGNVMAHFEEFNPNGLFDPYITSLDTTRKNAWWIYWNGTDEDGDLLTTDDTYTFYLKLYNCNYPTGDTMMHAGSKFSTDDIAWTVHLFAPPTGTPNPPPMLPASNIVRAYAPCYRCPSDVVIDTIPYAAHTYSSITFINAGRNISIPAGSTIRLEAENEIILDDGFTANVGSDVVAEIKECSTLVNFRGSNPNETEPDKKYFTAEYGNYVFGDMFPKEMSADNIEVLTKDNIKDYDIKIYPNPNTGEFTLQLGNISNGNYTLQITDVMGRSVIEQKINVIDENVKQKINLTAYSKGVYFVKISGTDVNEVRKVVYE